MSTDVCYCIYMTTTQTPTIIRYEDHEGDGTCTACGRDGLRWIARLSDGSGVGSECAKTVTGQKMATPKSISWVSTFTVIAEHSEYGDNYSLWSNGRQTRTTRNGILTAVGGQDAQWKKEGWLAA